MDKKENEIQAACVKVLRSHGIFFHSVPNEAGGRSMVMQSQLVTMGLRKGVADLCVWWPIPGREDKVEIGYVEFKTPVGSQSQWQKTFEAICYTYGIEYVIIRSVDGIIELMRKHGIEI